MHFNKGYKHIVRTCGSCGPVERKLTCKEIDELANKGCLCMMTKRRNLKEEGKWELMED